MSLFIKNEKNQYFKIASIPLKPEQTKLVTQLKKIKVTSGKEDEELLNKLIELLEKKFYVFLDSVVESPSSSPKEFKNNKPNYKMVYDALDDKLNLEYFLKQIEDLREIKKNFKKIQEIILRNIDKKKIQAIKKQKAQIISLHLAKRQKLLAKIITKFKEKKIKVKINGKLGELLRILGNAGERNFQNYYYDAAQKIDYARPLEKFRSGGYLKLLKISDFLKINDLTVKTDLSSLSLENTENVTSSWGYVVLLPNGFRGINNLYVKSITSAKIFPSMEAVNKTFKKSKNYEVIKIKMNMIESIRLVGKRFEKMGDFIATFENKLIENVFNDEKNKLLNKIAKYEQILQENNITFSEEKEKPTSKIIKL